ncbi:MAG TPA: hypothetical protein PKC90_14060, partial [Phycisphaerales bacterium]|nr:hypothetical protein [Phycisphaerales bacterium]
MPLIGCAQKARTQARTRCAKRGNLGATRRDDQTDDGATATNLKPSRDAELRDDARRGAASCGNASSRTRTLNPLIK